MKVRIYRVENKLGLGMYTSNASIEMHEMQGRHPSPRDDIGIGELWWKRLSGEIRFGFYSLEQFKFWVYKMEWRYSLKNEKYRISVYEAPIEAVIRGDTQMIFDIKRAKKLYTLCPTEV